MRILFYTNQFFGQIGGENKADIPPRIIDDLIGTANLFKDKVEGNIVATLICGDNYYAQNVELTRKFIAKEVERLKPDLVIAGPAFNAGRFGMACGDICNFINEKYEIETITGMYIENPAVQIYKKNTYIVKTGKSAASIKKAVAKMSELSNKIIRKETIGLSDVEGYIAKGIRINYFHEKTGAERALDMLIKKLKKEDYDTEILIPVYDNVKAAEPVKNLKAAKIALITTGGVVPFGNPDHLPAATAKFYKKYSINNIDKFNQDIYESVHAGYDPAYANENPNRILPLDILKEFEEEREIGELYEYYIVTTGNSTSVSDSTRMGKEIADELKKANVDGVILTST